MIPSTTLSTTHSTWTGRRKSFDLVETRDRRLPSWTVAQFHLPLNVGIHHTRQHGITAWKTKTWNHFCQSNQPFRCISPIQLTFSIFTYLSSRPTSALKNKRFWYLHISKMFLSLMLRILIADVLVCCFSFPILQSSKFRGNIKKFKVLN